MNKSIKSILGLCLAVLAALVVGLVIGLLAGFLSNLVYIVFLFPLGMGLIGGFFLEKTIAGAKIRKISQGVLLGCLMALAVYGAYQVMNYVTFRGRLLFEMHQKILEETGRSEPMVANAFVDYALKEETGFSGFPGYLLYMDKQGVTVGKMFGSGFNLGPFFTWVFWLLELGIIGWVTVGMGRQAAGRPFCEPCQRWYGKEHHLGGVGESSATALMQLLERRDFSRAGLMLEADAEVPSLEIYTKSCGKCTSSDTWLALKQISVGQNGKLNFKPGSQISIRPHEKDELMRDLRFGPEKMASLESLTARSPVLWNDIL
jgi:hypothetical protein